MWAPVGLAREEGEGESSRAVLCLDGEPPPDLTPLDMAILVAWTEKKSWTAMAKMLGVTPLTVKNHWNRPAMQAVVTRLQRNLFDQLSRGDFGAVAIVKANQIPAIKKTLKLMRHADSDKIQLEAARDIIRLAGIQPAKALVVDRPEQLLDEMTVEELEHFSLTNEIPRRLADKVARVAAGVLRQRRKPTASQDGAGEDTEGDWEPIDAQAQATDVPLEGGEEGPLELPDEDGPGWTDLPDETELEEGR